MEVTAGRAGELPALSLDGGMDGTGAQQVASAIQQHLNDHDTAIIFDLSVVDHLRSDRLLDEPGYEERKVTLDSGDLLVMYTDGVTEATDKKGDMFCEERLRKVIGESHALPAAEIVGTIRRAVESFCGDAPQSDDITIMVLKVK
jgi:serine/threonine protein phosphatase PrpC